MNYLTGYCLAVAATALWAGNFIVARAFNQDIPPISIAFWRWTIAAIALAPFALPGTIKDWKLVKKHLPYLAVTALLGVTAFNTLIYVASHTTQAINMSLIATASPIFMVIMSRIFYGERITWKKTAGIAIAMSGVLLLISGGSLENLLHIDLRVGDLYMLLAAIVFASYSILVKGKPPAMSTTTFSMSIFSIGLLWLAPLYGWELVSSQEVVFHRSLVLGLLYVGIFSSVVGYIAWNQAIVLIGPARTALIYYLIPVFSGIEAWLLLGEPITLVHIFSMLSIVSGIILTHEK